MYLCWAGHVVRGSPLGRFDCKSKGDTAFSLPLEDRGEGLFEELIHDTFHRTVKLVKQQSILLDHERREFIP